MGEGCCDHGHSHGHGSGTGATAPGAGVAAAAAAAAAQAGPTGAPHGQGPNPYHMAQANRQYAGWRQLVGKQFPPALALIQQFCTKNPLSKLTPKELFTFFIAADGVITSMAARAREDLKGGDGSGDGAAKVRSSVASGRRTNAAAGLAKIDVLLQWLGAVSDGADDGEPLGAGGANGGQLQSAYRKGDAMSAIVDLLRLWCCVSRARALLVLGRIGAALDALEGAGIESHDPGHSLPRWLDAKRASVGAIPPPIFHAADIRYCEALSLLGRLRALAGRNVAARRAASTIVSIDMSSAPVFHTIEPVIEGHATLALLYARRAARTSAVAGADSFYETAEGHVTRARDILSRANAFGGAIPDALLAAAEALLAVAADARDPSPATAAAHDLIKEASEGAMTMHHVESLLHAHAVRADAEEAPAGQLVSECLAVLGPLHYTTLRAMAVHTRQMAAKQDWKAARGLAARLHRGARIAVGIKSILAREAEAVLAQAKEHLDDDDEGSVSKLRQCCVPECGKVEPKAKAFAACGQCKYAVYCSADHQKVDWSLLHRDEHRVMKEAEEGDEFVVEGTDDELTDDEEEFHQDTGFAQMISKKLE